ncbi:MAG: hypothetical protein ACRCS9_06675, partial [Hyphomicrobium sp.]
MASGRSISGATHDGRRPSRALGSGRLAVGAAMRAFAATVVMLLASLLPATALSAAEAPLIRPGDAVVTGFSGTHADGEPERNAHPLDRQFINPDGISARVLDVRALGTGPIGAVSDTLPRHDVRARDVGQVFGVAVDDTEAPNAYVAATSLFGLQIVSRRADGLIERLARGDAGAEWMSGQFANSLGGGPGTVYRIDGRSGTVSVFATLSSDGKANAGPGLGALAYDARSRQMFVSDLETGLIHRIAMDGVVRDAFDHGVDGRKAEGIAAEADNPARRMDIKSERFDAEDPATWGYADPRRRVFGLAIEGRRLYYAVAEGPSIWSVSIGDDGAFGRDARLEIVHDSSEPGVEIASLAFDGAGTLYLAERGAVSGRYDYAAFAATDVSRVLRYRYDRARKDWVATPDDYAIGLKAPHHAATGGVALNYGYDKFGDLDLGACRQTVWSTGEHLRAGSDVARVSTGGAAGVHGLQGVYKSRVRPANTPPFESWFVDYDGRTEDPNVNGHIGAVAIHAPCAPPAETESPAYESYVTGIVPPEPQSLIELQKRCWPAAIGAAVRCRIDVRNISGTALGEDLRLTDVSRVMYGAGTGAVVPIASVAAVTPGVTCSAAPTPELVCTIPAQLLAPGDVVSLDVTVATGAIIGAGNAGFRNCAVIRHSQGHAKACAEGGTDIVVEKVGPAACLPGGTCKFGLRVANAGLMPFEGDVLLADAMFVGGGVVNAPVTNVAPPVACIAGNINQVPFTCLTHMSLAPGEEIMHWIDVTMPAPGGYKAENCFGVLDPALLPVGPLPPVLVGVGAG